MRRFLVVLSLPLALAALSCDRGAGSVERGGGWGRDELVIEPVDPVPVGSYDEIDGRMALDRSERHTEYARTSFTSTVLSRRGLGEGEIETASNESANQEISNAFRKQIDGNELLASAAGDTRLVAEHDGDLVLKGSVPTLDLWHAVEEFATELAGQPVQNELDIKNAVPTHD